MENSLEKSVKNDAVRVVDAPDPKKIDRIPDKIIVLLSSGNYVEQGYTVKRVELRLYQEKMSGQRGPYSIITTHVETDKGSIERIFDEGFRGKNAIEEVAAFLTSHPAISDIILRSVRKLKQYYETGREKIFEKRKEDLIKKMKRNGFLTDKKVEEAIRKAPRQLFVNLNFLDDAYEDHSLPTQNGQTISQPSVVARMTEWLDVKKGNKVLEIGCGSGWQSAILSFLVEDGKVFSIERSPNLVQFAKKNHEKAGIKNVEIIQGDGSLGLPEKSPFDRIIITAACSKVPKPLLEQLSTDGLLVAPVGEFLQSMVLLKKTKEGIKELKRELGYLFVPLEGKFGFRQDEKTSD